MSIFDVILNHPLGAMLEYTIRMLGSYGPGLILFTLFTKVLLFPVSFLSQRGTIKQMKVRPYEEIIRKKCGTDKARYNMEISALYKEHGVSVSSGCLPLFMQMPILLSLYKVMRMPLTYLLKLSADTISAIDTFLELGVSGIASNTVEVTIAQAMFENFEKLVAAGIIPPDVTPIDYSFLGMNLASKPSLAANMLLFIPLLAGVTAFLQSWYQAKSQPPSATGASTSKTMLVTMPLMSVWFTFSLPAGLGLYWSMSNMFQALQMMVLNSIMNPKKALAKAYETMEAEQQLAKQQKKELANQHRFEKESANRSAPNKKKKSQTVKDRILNDEFDDYQPASPTPQAAAGKTPTKGGYEKVLGYTSIPDPFDEDFVDDEAGESANKLKKRRDKASFGAAGKGKAAASPSADETDEPLFDAADDLDTDDDGGEGDV